MCSPLSSPALFDDPWRPGPICPPLLSKVRRSFGNPLKKAMSPSLSARLFHSVSIVVPHIVHELFRPRPGKRSELLRGRNGLEPHQLPPILSAPPNLRLLTFRIPSQMCFLFTVIPSQPCTNKQLLRPKFPPSEMTSDQKSKHYPFSRQLCRYMVDMAHKGRI